MSAILHRLGVAMPKATQDGDNHKWICEVTCQGKKYCRVLSHEKYNSFLQDNSDYSHIRKIPFEEIIALSREKISTLTQEGPQDDPRDYFNIQLERIVYQDNLFEKDVLNRIQTQLTQIQKAENEGRAIRDAVNFMFKRSIAKRQRLAEKANTIWEKIKFFIWSIFLDDRKAVQQQIHEINYRVPSVQEAQAACMTALKARILLNIELFEGNPFITEESRTNTDQYRDDKYLPIEGSWKKLKNKWLLKFHSDKIKLDEIPIERYAKGESLESLTTYRNRIIESFDLLEKLEKLSVVGVNVSKSSAVALLTE